MTGEGGLPVKQPFIPENGAYLINGPYNVDGTLYPNLIGYIQKDQHNPLLTIWLLKSNNSKAWIVNDLENVVEGAESVNINDIAPLLIAKFNENYDMSSYDSIDVPGWTVEQNAPSYVNEVF